MGALKLNQNTSYTFEEYLAFEEQAEEKHEYHNGKIVCMSGGTAAHATIVMNIGTAINNGFRGKPKKCRVISSDLKVYVNTANHAVYPDVMAVCNDLEYYKNRKDVITNPSLIVEVLSKSTKDYDQSAKFAKYRTLASFKEYVLIWQTIPKIQAWYKEANNLWRISSAFGLDNEIKLYSVDCTIKLSDIYEWITDLGEKEDFDAY